MHCATQWMTWYNYMRDWTHTFWCVTRLLLPTGRNIRNDAHALAHPVDSFASTASQSYVHTCKQSYSQVWKKIFWKLRDTSWSYISDHYTSTLQYFSVAVITSFPFPICHTLKLNDSSSAIIDLLIFDPLSFYTFKTKSLHFIIK